MFDGDTPDEVTGKCIKKWAVTVQVLAGDQQRKTSHCQTICAHAERVQWVTRRNLTMQIFYVIVSHENSSMLNYPVRLNIWTLDAITTSYMPCTIIVIHVYIPLHLFVHYLCLSAPTCAVISDPAWPPVVLTVFHLTSHLPMWDRCLFNWWWEYQFIWM